MKSLCSLRNKRSTQPSPSSGFRITAIENTTTVDNNSKKEDYTNNPPAKTALDSTDHSEKTAIDSTNYSEKTAIDVTDHSVKNTKATDAPSQPFISRSTRDNKHTISFIDHSPKKTEADAPRQPLIFRSTRGNK